MKNMNENTNVTTKGTPSLNMITSSTPSSSTSQCEIFNHPEFGNLRCIEIDGEPWFVGKDVATALGYGEGKSLANAVARHVDIEDRGVTEMMTPGGIQRIVIINESGLYALIFGSKLEKAKAFKHWVTSEVLPALRKTGSYTVAQNEDQNRQSKPMSREYLLATAFLESQKVIEENTREIARLSVKCNNLNDQVSQDQEVIDVMTKDVTPAEKRAVLNRLMTYKHGAVAGSRWSILYREFEEKYHFNLDIRMRNYNKNPDNKKCKSKVDYVDRVLGMLDELYALAVKLFRSDYDTLIEQTYHVRKTDEQIQNELMLDEIPDEVFERSNN